MKRAVIVSYWARMLTSFWFVPAVMAAIAASAASAMLWLDATYGRQLDLAGFGYGGSAEGASAILQTVASSMITIAGVVFSITLVTLSLASSQFGPRLLRNFIADKLNQAVLGMFAATFLYSVLVLREVRRAGETAAGFVPHLAVAGSVALAVASIALLIYFIHHVSVSIQADEVIRNVAAELTRAIDVMYPERVGNAARDAGQEGAQSAPICLGAPAAVCSREDGYVQVLDPDGLMRAAVRHDLLIRVVARPGDYAVAMGVLAQAWPAQRADEEAARDVASCFALGPTRTPDQDVAFLIGQLVEVAIRALSAGVNDPFTAMACVDRLASAFRRVAGREPPAACRFDDAGRLRVLAEPPAFATLLADAFDPIRRYARGEVAVGARMLGAIALIAPAARREGDRRCLLAQADRIRETVGDGLRAAYDREALDRAHAAAVAALGAQ